MLGDISHMQTNKGAREIVHQSKVESYILLEETVTALADIVSGTPLTELFIRFLGKGFL